MNVLILLALIFASLSHLSDGKKQPCMLVGDTGICTQQITPECKEFIEIEGARILSAEISFDHFRPGGVCSNLNYKQPKIASRIEFSNGVLSFLLVNGEKKPDGYFKLNSENKVVFMPDNQIDSDNKYGSMEGGYFELTPQCQDLLSNNFEYHDISKKDFANYCSNLANIVEKIAFKLGLADRTIFLKKRRELGFSVVTSGADIIISFSSNHLFRSIMALKGALAHELCHVRNGDTTIIDGNYYSPGFHHKNEFRADACSADIVGASAMIQSIGMHGLNSHYTYTHPSSLDRVAALNRILKKQEEAAKKELKKIEMPLEYAQKEIEEQVLELEDSNQCASNY